MIWGDSALFLYTKVMREKNIIFTLCETFKSIKLLVVQC